MNSSAAVLSRPVRGAQRPRFLSLPDAVDEVDGDYGDRAVQLADLAGLNLDPWQQLALRAMLRRQADGQWAAFESCLLVPRQNGKSVDLEAFDLAKLYLSEPGHLILHSAHLFPTAMESFRHLTGLIRNCPELWAEVARVSKAHGEEGIELKNGSRLRFAARTVTGAGRGFSPDDVVLDEAFKLPHEALSALMPALAAKPNPQLVYASSTGYPDSEILWSLVERGRRGGDDSLAYLEWCADTGADLDDREAWAQANPALGYRLTEKKMAAERASMRDEDFARERLGLWADTSRKGPFPAGAWEDLGNVRSKIAGPVSFSVDVAEDRSWAAIAAAGEAVGGGTHVEIVDYRPGTGWLVAKCAEVVSRHVAANVVVQTNSPAGSLVPELLDAQIRVVKASSGDYAQACGAFFDAVCDGAIRHIAQGELDFAVQGALKRPSGDAFVWDRRKSSIDISPLTAATLAAWGHKVHGAVDVSEAVW